MSKAAYCAECGANVYLTADGRCPKGHGPESLSNYYEVPDATQPSAPAPSAAAPGQPMAGPPKKKSKVGMIIAIVAVVLLLCTIAGGVATCSFFSAVEDEVADGFDTISSDIDITPAPAPDSDVAPTPEADSDIAPAPEGGVVRVELSWDEAVDMDLEVWDADGQSYLVDARVLTGEVLDGTVEQEYLDFVEYDEWDLSSGTYVISVCCYDAAADISSANVVLTVTAANGSTVQHSKTINWETDTDQWHAFSIDAETGDIEDIDLFIEASTD